MSELLDGLIDAGCIFDYISPGAQLISEAFGFKPLTITDGPAGKPVRAVLDLLRQHGVGVGPTPYWQPGEGLMLTVDDKDRALHILARAGYEAV